MRLGYPWRVLGVIAACFVATRSKVLGWPPGSTTDSKNDCNWFSGNNAAVFRVIATRIYKKRARYSQKAAGFRIGFLQ